MGEKQYSSCKDCTLIHLAAEHRLGAAEERAHYELHENDPSDPRYRAFLERLAAPLVERLDPGACGLDYGSGPGPTLSVMLEELGFPTTIYDPFFAPDACALQSRYDFITCSETVEHFFHPRAELEMLAGLLRPGGIVAIMTEMVPEDRPFEKWSYARDPTHVCFYRPTSMEWIARHFGWNAERVHPNVFFFTSPSAQRPPRPARRR